MQALLLRNRQPWIHINRCDPLVVLLRNWLDFPWPTSSARRPWRWWLGNWVWTVLVTTASLSQHNSADTASFACSFRRSCCLYWSCTACPPLSQGRCPWGRNKLLNKIVETQECGIDLANLNESHWGGFPLLGWRYEDHKLGLQETASATQPTSALSLLLVVTVPLLLETTEPVTRYVRLLRSLCPYKEKQPQQHKQKSKNEDHQHFLFHGIYFSFAIIFGP